MWRANRNSPSHSKVVEVFVTNPGALERRALADVLLHKIVLDGTRRRGGEDAFQSIEPRPTSVKASEPSFKSVVGG